MATNVVDELIINIVATTEGVEAGFKAVQQGLQKIETVHKTATTAVEKNSAAYNELLAELEKSKARARDLAAELERCRKELGDSAEQTKAAAKAYQDAQLNMEQYAKYSRVVAERLAELDQVIDTNARRNSDYQETFDQLTGSIQQLIPFISKNCVS